jgi:hypothetical protein
MLVKNLALCSFLVPFTLYASVDCSVAAPQSPRDITKVQGENPQSFPFAPAYSEMNLCNIHSHTSAENKGPGFSVKAKAGQPSGYVCDGADSLTAEELKDPFEGKGAFGNVKPGDTIEVHWVFSTCDAKPGKGLSSCVPEGCTDPKLRVEAQAFLLVNDPKALKFDDFVLANERVGGFYQPKQLPTGTGTPVSYLGSTTGVYYNDTVCSPAEVTWNVRPMCARLDISSLEKWAREGNIFEETESHGARELVEDLKLLSPIENMKK